MKIDNKVTNYSKVAFICFLLSVLLIVANSFWLGYAESELVVREDVVGAFSAIPVVAYLVFNIRGIVFSIKSIRAKEPNSLLKIIGLLGNFILGILPATMIILIMLMMFGVDVWSYFTEAFNS